MNRMMEERNFVSNYIDIPKIFYPEEGNIPFVNCTICHKDLLNNDVNYLIEKAYKQELSDGSRKLVFEFVYCLDCLEKFRDEFSKESKLKIDQFFDEKTNLEKRQNELIKYDLFEPEIWLNNCIVKNKSIDEVEEFQICALCNGGDMLYHHYPYMICGEAMDELVEVLSPQTLDIINDFWINNTGLPPEIEDIFKTKRPILF